MSDYVISEVRPTDRRTMAEIDRLLQNEGITRDANLDYTCAVYDEDYHVIATGSCFGSTLRCFAVRNDHQGEGLLNTVLSHLISVQYERGNSRLFLYTKTDSARFFGDLGFYEITRVDGTLVFMENRRDGFKNYLTELSASRKPGKSAALVMNANPFTLGHQYLVEKAAAACDHLHLFIVSEDASLIPFAVRKKLVLEGVSHLPNVICHDSGPYIISNATFPSYFLKDEAAVIEGHARLDLEIFKKIAAALSITERFVGEEPTSQVTGIYNEIMARELPKAGIGCTIVPRKKRAGINLTDPACCPERTRSGRPGGNSSSLFPSEKDEEIISASTVRACLKKKDFAGLAGLVPPASIAYFQSPEFAPVLEKICRADNVIHY